MIGLVRTDLFFVVVVFGCCCFFLLHPPTSLCDCVALMNNPIFTTSPSHVNYVLDFVNVTLVFYGDDSLFPSVLKNGSSLSLAQGVVSFVVQSATGMNLNDPITAEFWVRQPDFFYPSGLLSFFFFQSS